MKSIGLFLLGTMTELFTLLGFVLIVGTGFLVYPIFSTFLIAVIVHILGMFVGLISLSIAYLIWVLQTVIMGD